MTLLIIIVREKLQTNFPGYVPFWRNLGDQIWQDFRLVVRTSHAVIEKPFVKNRLTSQETYISINYSIYLVNTQEFSPILKSLVLFVTQVSFTPGRWIRSLCPPPGRGVRHSSKVGFLCMTLNCIWWWGSSSADLGSVLYLFIEITPRSTLTWSGSTCSCSLSGSTRSV